MLATDEDRAAIIARLRRVRPDSVRRWGRMTAHQMIRHLGDAMLMGTPDKPVSDATGMMQRTVVKWIALYVPAPWPPGIRTRPELDQTIGGTPPGVFEADVALVEALIERSRAEDFFAGRAHPIFGPLSDRAWRRWGYLHFDHHLRQFGE
jgi:hypothetical protein